MSDTCDVNKSEFIAFPKMARLSRECLISEKIDGSNSQIYITDEGKMLVGSRTRWITPENDNYGFARWCADHKEELLKLGPGRHFGEWYGSGIQRRYGLTEKRFSLFNVSRWIPSIMPDNGVFEIVPNEPPRRGPSCVSVVPTLYRGPFSTGMVEATLAHLAVFGSVAAPGFMQPEGIIVFHTAAGIGFKKTFKDDSTPKSLTQV